MVERDDPVHKGLFTTTQTLNSILNSHNIKPKSSEASLIRKFASDGYQEFIAANDGKVPNSDQIANIINHSFIEANKRPDQYWFQDAKKLYELDRVDSKFVQEIMVQALINDPTISRERMMAGIKNALTLKDAKEAEVKEEAEDPGTTFQPRGQL